MIFKIVSSAVFQTAQRKKFEVYFPNQNSPHKNMYIYT